MKSKINFNILILSLFISLASFSLCNVEAAKTSTELKSIEQKIKDEKAEKKELEKKQKALTDELKHTKEKMVDAAQEVQKHEVQLTELEENLKDLKSQEKDLSSHLEKNKDKMVHVIAALQRLSVFPTEALLAQPKTPLEMIRSSMLLNATLPILQKSAEDLEQNLTDLKHVREETEEKLDQIAAVTEKMEAEHQKIAMLYQSQEKEQNQLKKEYLQTAENLKKFAKEAKSIRELIAKASAEKKARDAKMKTTDIAFGEGSFKDAKGHIALPAQGKIVQKFGTKNEAGLDSKGISIATRSDAQVVAPYDGTVLFAGPFKGYGQVLIIEHGKGYHSFLAGLDQLKTQIGNPLLAGEPIGLMPKGKESKLYLEFRYQSQPFNPLNGWINMKG